VAFSKIPHGWNTAFPKTERNSETQSSRSSSGRVKIIRNGSTVLRTPATSENAALISVLSTFVTKCGIQVTIRGTAIIDAFLFGLSVPFEKTLPVTIEQVA
jgi:hypothetical protein